MLYVFLVFVFFLNPSFVKFELCFFLFDQKSFLALAFEKILRPSGGGCVPQKPFDKNQEQDRNPKNGVVRPCVDASRQAGV